MFTTCVDSIVCEQQEFNLIFIVEPTEIRMWGLYSENLIMISVSTSLSMRYHLPSPMIANTGRT